MKIAVVGAHLTGQPLNGQLTERDGVLVATKKTRDCYQLYAIPGTVPAKPGLVRAKGDIGGKIEVEVWELSTEHFGSFVGLVPAPMCIGTIELEDGQLVKGFLCEGYAVEGAEEITKFGGWRAFLASRKT